MRLSLPLLVGLFAVNVMPAGAGIANTPLPTGLPIHLYDVPGVIVVFDPGPLSVDTYFVCTSAESVATAQFAVEVFDEAGAPINTASPITVAPGASGMFILGTFASNDNWAAWFINGASYFVANTPGIHGSARIVSTSKKLLCSAFLAGNTVGGLNPPRDQLNVIYKLKQKGD